MAASYAAKHPDDFDGIVLLAAYSTADLTQSGLQIVQICRMTFYELYCTLSGIFTFSNALL